MGAIYILHASLTSSINIIPECMLNRCLVLNPGWNHNFHGSYLAGWMVSQWCLSGESRKHGIIHLCSMMWNTEISPTEENWLWNSVLCHWAPESETWELQFCKKTNSCILRICLLMAFFCQYCLFFMNLKNFLLIWDRITNRISPINLLKCY